MAIATTTMQGVLATAYGSNSTFISLHTASPGTTGTNEATGGSYARVATTWGAASAGAITGSQVTINAAAGTYTHVGLWTLGTGGVFQDSYALPTAVVLSVAGTIKVTPTFTES